MHGLEDRMPAHRRLPAVVPRLGGSKLLPHEVLGVSSDRLDPHAPDVGTVFRRQLETAPKLAPGKTRKGLVSGHGRSLALLPRASVQPAPQLLPARKPRVHKGVELRSVVVCLQMRQLVNDHVLDERERSARQLDVVRDKPLAPVAAAPEGLHLPELSGDRLLAKSHAPGRGQAGEQTAERRELGFSDLLVRWCRPGQHLLPRLPYPVELRAQKRLAVTQCRPRGGNGESHHAVRGHAQVDPSDPLARHDNGNPVNTVLTGMNHDHPIDRMNHSPCRVQE